MPVCPVCEGDNFDLLDGLYYCRICSSQSQEIVEEDFDNVEEMAIGRVLDKGKRRKSKFYNEIDHGKPWFTVEGLQSILKSQVHALYYLGCSQKLSKVVQQIWLKYVHKCGIATIDPDVYVAGKQPENSMSFRDQYLSGVFGDNLDKDVLPNIKHCVMLRPPSISKAGKRRKSTPSSSENEMTGIPINPRKSESREPVRALGSDEEWFSLASEEEDSGSDRSNASSVPSTSPTSSPSNRYERPDRKQHNVRQERKKLNTLNKPKLLAILNIAVQWCKEPITTGDLLNWVKQGYLPYIDALHALEPHMKISNFDVANIQLKSIPSHAELVKLTNMMITFVGMPSMPDVDISSLVARYVGQLNLPFEIIVFTNHLLKVDNYKYTRSTTKKESYMPDIVAISFIVVSLKLLFGLNDDYEWSLNQAPKSDAEYPTHDCQHFKWKTWVRYHLKRRQMRIQNPKTIFDAKDAEAVMDLHAYYEHWDSVVLNAHLSSKEKAGGRKSTKYRLEMIEMRKWALQKLCDRQGSTEQIERSFILRQNAQVFPSPSEEENMKDNCICHAIQMLKDGSLGYSLIDSNPHKRHNKHQMGESDLSVYSDTYNFLLSLAHELTTACKQTIHTKIYDIEKLLVAKHLIKCETP